jgi:transposase InsO family protein
VAERRACRLVGLSRSTYRYRVRAERQDDRARLRGLVAEPARRHPRYGYRRITALLRRRGEFVNHKRVWRLWRAAGLSLPRRRPRKRRPALAPAVAPRATHRGPVWTYDLAFDRTEGGRPLKLLAVLDEHPRECHRIRVGRRLDAAAVLETLAAVFAAHGAPAHLRSDNGGEFLAWRVQAWLRPQGTQTVFIAPGHP